MQAITNHPHLIAGMDLKNSEDLEFYGNRKDKTVIVLQAGHAKPFAQLDRKYYQMIKEALRNDEGAQQYFSSCDYSEERQVELYTYFMWGDLDHTPDISGGTLQPSENFRDSLECPSMDFTNKHFTIDDQELSKRDMIIIDMSARECTDFEIADRLNIAIKTLDSHKTKLLKKLGCGSKLGMVSKSYRQHLIHS